MTATQPHQGPAIRSITLDLENEAMSFIAAALSLQGRPPDPTEHQIITALCELRGHLLHGHLNVIWENDTLSHTILCNRIKLLIVHLHDKTNSDTHIETLLNEGLHSTERLA